MRPANAYLRFFETMTPATIHELAHVVTVDVRFTDPFNDVVGVDAMRRVLAKMFEDVEEPRFQVTHAVDAGDGVCLVRWMFRCRFRGRPWQVPGMSELHLASDGRVAVHIDHWDSGRHFYARLPLIGTLIRFIRRRCAV